MPLEGTQQQYYGFQSFTATAGQTAFTLTFPNTSIGGNINPTMPQLSGEFNVTINGVLTSSWTYAVPTITYTGAALSAGDVVKVQLINPDLGNYQFIKIDTIIQNFIVAYVGRDKIIPRVKRSDVAFHAQRGLQELSYDTFKSVKSQEIEIASSLKFALPHDYVNYVKISWKDQKGIERIIYPARDTSNPTAILQDANYAYTFDSNEKLLNASDSQTWAAFQLSSGSSTDANSDATIDEILAGGRRYGLEPEKAQGNGVYYIDNSKGYINFSSDLSGKTITLQYVSDGLGSQEDMIVHKFAEEAMYKHIAHGILATRAQIPEGLVQRFKRERYAAIRTAKLRLSNLKLSELTQVMRNKSKIIKH